jgi:hypothetical protein
MTRLEHWTQELKRSRPNAERLIGKRKRGDDDYDCFASISGLVSKKDHELIMTALSQSIQQQHSRLQAFLYFYLDFIHALLTLSKDESSLWESHGWVFCQFVAFVEVQCIHLMSVVTRDALLVQIVCLLSELSRRKTHARECVRCCETLLMNLLTKEIVRDESANHFFLSGSFSTQRLQAEIHHICTVLLVNQCEADVQTDSSHFKSLLPLWLRSRETISVTKVIELLAHDDEALFDYLLASIKVYNALNVSRKEDVPNASQVSLDLWWRDVVQSLHYLMDSILQWDETVLVDFMASEETVALEYWLRAMKTLQWSDLEVFYSRETMSTDRENVRDSSELVTRDNQPLSSVLIHIEELNCPILPSSTSCLPAHMQLHSVSIIPVLHSTTSGEVQQMEEDEAEEDSESHAEVDTISDRESILLVWKDFLCRLDKILQRRHKKSLLSFSPAPLLRAIHHFSR